MFNFISRLSLQTKAICILTACLISFIGGWTLHGWKTDAGVTHTIAKAEKTRSSDEKQQGEIVKNAQSQQSETKVIYRTIREKVYVQDDKSVCFSPESWGLWNASISANTDIYRRKLAGGTPATGPAEGEQPAGPDEGQSTGEKIATVQDVLINGTDNFEICTDNSIKHLALIKRVRSLQGKMCYCSN